MLIFLLFALLIAVLIAYFYVRDKGIVAQLDAYEQAIEHLSQKVHALEKKSADQNLHAPIALNLESELAQIEARFKSKLDELSDPLLKTIRALGEMEAEVKRINESANERISKLEENSKLSTMSSSAKLINEKAIVDLYKAGYSAEEISKRERTPLGEVELILRIANLK